MSVSRRDGIDAPEPHLVELLLQVLKLPLVLLMVVVYLSVQLVEESDDFIHLHSTGLELLSRRHLALRVNALSVFIQHLVV